MGLIPGRENNYSFEIQLVKRDSSARAASVVAFVKPFTQPVRPLEPISGLYDGLRETLSPVQLSDQRPRSAEVSFEPFRQEGDRSPRRYSQAEMHANFPPGKGTAASLLSPTRPADELRSGGTP